MPSSTVLLMFASISIDRKVGLTVEGASWQPIRIGEVRITIYYPIGLEVREQDHTSYKGPIYTYRVPRQLASTSQHAGPKQSIGISPY